MNLEGEGSFKLGGETYNIKVIVTKQEKLKNEKNALSKVMGFLDKTFSSLKTNQEEKTEDKLKEFIVQKMKEFIPNPKDEKNITNMFEAIMELMK